MIPSLTSPTLYWELNEAAYCLASKTRTRLVELFAHGKAYRQAIGVKLIAHLLSTRTTSALRGLGKVFGASLFPAVLI